MTSSGNTQAAGTASRGRFEFEALSRTQVQRGGCRRSAAEYSAFGAGNHAQVLAVLDREATGDRWIGCGGILAPLPGVTVHVKESVIVRHFVTHRLHATVRILNIPGIATQEWLADAAV